MRLKNETALFHVVLTGVGDVSCPFFFQKEVVGISSDWELTRFKRNSLDGELTTWHFTITHQFLHSGLAGQGEDDQKLILRRGKEAKTR